MEYVIRDEKEKPKETEVWLEKRSDGRILFYVGEYSILDLKPDGTVLLHTGIPKHNKEGIQTEEFAECRRIKLVE